MRPPTEPHRPHRDHHAHPHAHGPPPSRRPLFIGLAVAVAVAVVAAAVWIWLPPRFVIDPGEAASDYLLRCGRSFERGRYEEAYGLCSIELAKPARPRIHVDAARRMALSMLAAGDTARAREIVGVLEGRLGDVSGGAIRGAALHVAGRFAEAAAAFRACRSANQLLPELTDLAAASRRLEPSHDTIQGLSRIRCGPAGR